MTRRIRNSAKAIVFRDEKMLAAKIEDKDGVYYIMPGGGQKSGETLEEAVTREVAEEFGICVKAKSLEFVIEGVTGEDFHRVDLVFLCDYVGEVSNVEIKRDLNQVGYAWLPVKDLVNEPLYPSKLRAQIVNLYYKRTTEVYLGNESMDS